VKNRFFYTQFKVVLIRQSVFFMKMVKKELGNTNFCRFLLKFCPLMICSFIHMIFDQLPTKIHFFMENYHIGLSQCLISHKTQVFICFQYLDSIGFSILLLMEPDASLQIDSKLVSCHQYKI
jgi:hypothetical protein